MKTLQVLLLGVLINLSIGCTRSVDFDQIDDADVFSSYLFTLVYFDVDSDFFLNNNEEELLIKDVFELPISGKSQDYIERIEFKVVTENSFERDISFQIIFFDLAGSKIYTLQPVITVSAMTPETTYYLEIPKQDLEIIFRTEQVGFELVMTPSSVGTVLTTNDPYNFSLKSAIEIFVNLGNL